MPGTILFGIDVETANENALGFLRKGTELFEGLEVPVTWYVTGRTLETYPEQFRSVDGSPHIELQAHTYAHLLLKSVLLRVPEGKTIHDSSDWFFKEGGTLREVDLDLERCQQVFQTVLARRATALTGPWGYYRGLGDRPDLLEVVERHGFRILRTWARNEDDGQPVPLEWQPFFYRLQGCPHILECFVHDYQDQFYWEAFTDQRGEEAYLDHLKEVARTAAREGLTWGLCSHDHGCAIQEQFQQKARWWRGIVEYARELGIRFLSASQFYQERSSEGPEEGQ